MDITERAYSPISTTASNLGSYFHVIDYVVFAFMLAISAAIGVYFAIKSRNKTETTTTDYLMANREMTFGPVALSLLASFMSSVTVLGVPAEYYVYGTMFTWFGVIYLIMPFVVGWVYMPVFYNLGIASTYEYLEMRFNRPTRLLVTVLYLILSVFYGGVVMYGPALALSRVTGLHMWGSIMCTGSVCMFYTALGGLKAVIWTDVVQCILMFSGFLIVIIQGSINLGGFKTAWEEADNGRRIDFMHFEADPRIRHTFWSIMCGGIIAWTAIYGVNQSQVQRYVCCRTRKHAEVALLLNGIGLLVIMIAAGMTGLIIYATYKDCDPLDSGKISTPDQLFPYIIMDIVGHIRGIPGLFVAAVFSSSLSTVSSGINAMSCVTVEDFIKPTTKWSEKEYTRISKILVVVYGMSYIAVAYSASAIGGLIRMAYSIHGMIGGPMVAVFTLGILLPWVNKWGAMSGAIVGLFSTVWMFIGTTLYPRLPEHTRPLPRSTTGCTDTLSFQMDRNAYNYSTTVLGHAEESSADYTTVSDDDAKTYRTPIVEFYSLSYLHFATLGFAVTMIVGMLTSALTGNTKIPTHQNLLTPLIRKKAIERNSEVRGSERSTSWTPVRSVLPEYAIPQNDMSSFSEPKRDAEIELKRPLVSSNEHVNARKTEITENESSL